MTVKELKDFLRNVDDNADVIVGDNSGANNDYMLKVKSVYQLQTGDVRIEVRGLANVIENAHTLLST